MTWLETWAMIQSILSLIEIAVGCFMVGCLLLIYLSAWRIEHNHKKNQEKEKADDSSENKL